VKRVGIDFHVVDGIFQGSRSHVLEVFRRVFRICPDIQFYLFLEEIEILHELSADFLLPNVKLIRMKHTNPVKRLCMQLPAFQKKYNLDLLHTQYISPIPSFCKTIITLHDILFESHPEYFSSLFNLRSKLLMRASAARATHIFTVSEYSKDEILSRYKVSPENITTIYNGADREQFYPGANGIQVINDNKLKSGEYILTVGRLEPRKNHLSLINAYAKLNTDIPLVIIGQRHFGYQQIETRISELGLSDRILILERVSEADLASFYRHAKFFVYPTWAEGFGMPVIEAMASGVPVITSNTTSLPEIAASAAILIAPQDISGLREAMSSLLSNDVLRRELRSLGLIRAESFKWDKSAESVKHVYESILYE
jgi:glycosyltransferase involved in cell wall biosynthesis